MGKVCLCLLLSHCSTLGDHTWLICSQNTVVLLLTEHVQLFSDASIDGDLLLLELCMEGISLQTDNLWDG